MNFKKYFKNKNILLTGIYGFVGSNLCKKLLECDARVYGVYKNNSTYSLLNIEKITGFNTVQYSENNFEIIEELIFDKDIEHCFHLASQVEVQKAFLNPIHTFENNINLTIKLLDTFRSSNSIKSIILTSTDKVYGDTDFDKLPYKEELIPNPIYPYEVSKYICELISKCYYQNYNLPLVITRTSNIFGPGQLNFSAIIPSLINSSIKNLKFLPRTNGKLKRDYMFIDDWVNSLMHLSFKKSEEKVDNLVYNFGNNKPKSAIDITNSVFKVLNDENKMEQVLNSFKKISDSKNEIIDQFIDSRKAEKELSIKYETNFDESIKNTVEWYVKYF